MEGNISNILPHISHQSMILHTPPESIRNEESQPADVFMVEKEVPLSAGEHRQEKTKKPLKEYTILAYEAAANNLENSIVNDVKEMESCPPSDNYNLVVQLSRYHIPDLTREFLAAALSWAFTNHKFKESLQELVSDEKLLAQYSELLKDSYVTNRIALILLQRNPALQERIDRLVMSKVNDALRNNRNLAQVLDETAKEVLSRIDTRQRAKEKEKLLKSFATSIQVNSLMEQEDEENIGDDIVRVTGEFIRGVEDIRGGEVGVYNKGSLDLAKVLGGRRDSILFVDSALTDKPRYQQGDYDKYLDWVDGVEINNEPLWRGVRRYEIKHDDDLSRINSAPLANLGFKEMSKVETLADFIIWGIKKYPANHFIVLLSNHGAGFLGAEEDRGNMLSLADLREAFEMVKKKTGRVPDILAFDCCFMGQTEVAYELKDSAKYMVASEEVIGGDGYPYKTLLPAIDKTITEGKKDPKDIATIFVDEGKKVNKKSTFTLSVLDLSAIDAVVKAVDQLATHILEGKADIEEVKNTLKKTQKFNVRFSPMRPYDDFRDLGDFAERLDKNPNITDQTIKEDLRTLKEALNNAVIKEQHMDDEDYEGSKGLSVYAPRRKNNISIPLMKEYEKTRMAKDTKWTELIKKLTDYEELVKEEEGKENKPKLTFIPLPERPL